MGLKIVVPRAYVTSSQGTYHCSFISKPSEPVFRKGLVGSNPALQCMDTCLIDTDTSLSWTVCSVLGERKPLHFLLIQPAKYRHRANTDTFCGPLSVHINGVLLYTQ